MCGRSFTERKVLCTVCFLLREEETAAGEKCLREEAGEGKFFGTVGYGKIETGRILRQMVSALKGALRNIRSK